MRKFLFWRRFRAYTAYTGAANAVSLPHLFKRKCRTSAASLIDTLHWLVSLLKMPFNSRVCRSSVSTSPNFAQEHEKEGYGRILVDDREPIYHDPYGSDEYDEEDFDGWLSDEEWRDLMDDEEEEIKSWQQRAVDEAIDDSQRGNIPW